MISREGRIKLLLAIDIVFFFLELVVGYAVGSLAIVADSFHMLNDVMSLIVALYAIKLTANSSSDSRYTYGWHRAEILAALINGVFLLALCLTICLEAIQRFFGAPEISNPRLVVGVGICGLASNIVGLFLFQGHAHPHSHSDQSSPPKKVSPNVEPISDDTNPRPHTLSRSRSTSFTSLYGHPAATRASLVQAANDIASQARPPSPTRRRHDRRASLPSGDADHTRRETAILPSSAVHETTPLMHAQVTERSPSPSSTMSGKDHGHMHSGSMNMQALILHVFGDALGNIGVIASGLVIWLTDWSFKYYFDPMISLVIAVIIFSSALPLVRSASFILLQGVPATISFEDVRSSILDVEGVLSLHELHIWQLSETKIVASVHVMASREHDFMPVASNIRKALHHHGIHSSTIQPEYHHPRNTPSKTSCLIPCPPDRSCNPSENACCRM